MAATRLTRAESKSRTRQRLLDTGARVFRRKGFHAATVEEIAGATGFTRGAFYGNFADKADLLLTIVEDDSRSRMVELDSRLRAVRSDDEILGVVVSWFEEMLVDWPLERAFAEFAASGIDSSAHRRRLARRMHDARSAIASMVDDYCDRAGVTLPVPSMQFAGITVALANGLAVQRRLDPAALPANLFGDSLAYVWFGLLATPG